MTVKSDVEELDQRTLELVYGLMDDDEAAELRRRIAEEPAAAEAHQRAVRAAGVFAAAAKWKEATIEMRNVECGMGNAEVRNAEFGVRSDQGPRFKVQGPTSERSPLSVQSAASSHSAVPSPQSALDHDSLAPLRRALQWAVGIAATVLFAFLLGGYLHHRGRLSEVAARHLRVTVTGPSQLTLGMANSYQIQTTDVLGEPQSVKLQCTFFDMRGQKIAAENAWSDDDGRCEFTCPKAAVVGGGARLEVLAFHRDDAYRLEAATPVAPYRFLTRAATDKPLYRPGEVVRFRSVTLGRFGLDTPADLPVHFEVHDPSGAVVAGSEQEGITQRGVGNGEFLLPADRAGGEYQLIARSLDGAFPEEKRKFFVRDYRVPELKKELEFVRDSYTPGDRVAADLSVNKGKGGAAAGTQLTITATVDGQTVYQATDKASETGTFRVEFELPKAIERGDGQLAVQCDDGGTRETIAKSIPINLGKVELKFYPEGGELVAGLENRVYFAATNPLGKPVHVEGSIVNDAGDEVARIETKHKGMGAFALAPAGEATYAVRLSKPAGVKSESKLPAVAANSSVVLSTGVGVFEGSKPIEATLECSKADVPLVVAAYCRGVQVGQEMLTTKSGKNAVSLALPEEASGVVRLTVYDYSKQKHAASSAAEGESTKARSNGGVSAKDAPNDAPLSTMPRAIAERLVYRKPARRLAVGVPDHAKQYSPGDKVELSLLCTSESGQPAKDAVLGLAVVDDSLLKLADDDTAAMPTHFYLASEVEKPEDLEKVDFYLSDNPKADEALDLLLGTQGWRRFVERSLDDLQKKAKEAGQPVKPEPPVERLLALGGAELPPTVIDNLDEVRPAYERARGAAEADYRDAVGQLRRAAIYGGLILGGLLIAVNVVPLLRRQRTWDWRVVARRFGPALVATSLCVLAGLLWRPGELQTATSELVALNEFKLHPPAAVRPEFNVLALGRTEDFGSVNVNGINHYWYWGRGDQWRNMNLAQGLGMSHEFAFDLYGIEPRDGWEKLGGIGLPQRDRVMLGNQWGDWDGDRDGTVAVLLKQRGYMVPLAAYDVDAFVKQQQQQNFFFMQHGGAPGRNADYLAFSPAGWAQWDVDAKAFKEQVEALRFPVREYAHQHTAGEPGVRSDFAETVFWNPLLVSDENGRAKVSFDLADSVTSFRVLAEAHDGAGRIGTGGGELFARLPFAIEPKLPIEVNAGDRIEVTVGVSNDSTQSVETAVSCKVGGDVDPTVGVRDGTRSVPTTLLKLVDTAEQRLAVPPGERRRTQFTLDVVGQKGAAEVEVRGAAGSLTDAKRQSIRVVPPGFPVAESYAGRISGEQELTIKVPASVVPGTLEVTLCAYPSTIATLQSGLEGILREPSGCFEQASSSNYPNLLLLQYLGENKVSQPELTRRGKEFLSAGYVKLTGYECKNHGFEWFGADPGHEALTAYGLMEFRDMARVHQVDAALLDRTGKWLLDHRDGNGGFQRNGKKLDGFGAAPDHITNAYIVWALSESGQAGIENELGHAIEHARGSADPYEVALAASSAVNAKREADGRELLGKLKSLQEPDGKLVGKEGSITKSGGEALAIETTALAALAWLKAPEFREQANRAIDWIVRNRSGNGGFGSTQATILALKALVEHAKSNRGRLAAGELVVKHGDRVIGKQAFAADEVNTIKLGGFEGQLTPGENKLSLSLGGENEMPYTIDVSYRAQRPNSHPDCPVELTTKLGANEVKAGETIALEAELVNKTDQGQPMTVAILGLPAGLQPRADQLEDLKKAGTIDYYETRAREVICYWRSLAPKKRVPLKLDLVAEWPGKYTGPASRAYLYYTAEQKQWVEPLAIEIAR